MTSVSVSLWKTTPSACELPLEGGVVLDDAVVDDGDGAVAADVRVGVAVGGRAVRRPAGVADADAAGGRLVAQRFRQVGDAAGLLAQVQPVARQGGHAGAVVAAVFQPPQPFDQDRLRLPPADVADDAAHGSPFLAEGIVKGGGGECRPTRDDAKTAFAFIQRPQARAAGQHDVGNLQFARAVDGGVDEGGSDATPTRLRPHDDVVNLPVDRRRNQEQPVHTLVRPIERDEPDGRPDGQKLAARAKLGGE